MPVLRRRAKKIVRKKFKKKIKLSDVDRVWKDYVKYGIVEEMIKYGKVQVDKNFSLEIVGEYIVDNKRIYSIFSRGVGMRAGIETPSANLHKGRPDVIYKVVLTDNNFTEGKLFFTPTRDISEAVHRALVDTNNYYRIK